MPLKAAQLMQADELETQVIDVPEWARDGESKVMIRAMSGLAMSRYQARMQAASEGEKDKDVAFQKMTDQMTLAYVAASIVDPDTGEVVFDTPEAMEVLAKKNGRGLQRVFEAAAALNRDTPDSVEAFRKNSPETPADAPGGSTPSSMDTPTPTP